MSSTRRIDASRANGARSRGPVTESGKQISSQNACRHGLLARCVVVEGESHEGFEETLTEHLERFQPADGVELGIVEEMVAASRRMRRAWAIESRLLSEGIDAQPPCDPTGRLTAAFNSLADSPALALSPLRNSPPPHVPARPPQPATLAASRYQTNPMCALIAQDNQWVQVPPQEVSVCLCS